MQSRLQDDIYNLLNKEADFRFWIFIAQCCLLSKNDADKAYIIECFCRSYAEKLCGRQTHLISAVILTLKAGLTSNTNEFTEWLTDFIKQKAELNLKTKVRFFVSIMKVVKELEAINYNISSMKRRTIKESVGILEDETRNDTDILLYVTQNKGSTQISEYLRKVIAKNSVREKILNWAIAADDEANKEAIKVIEQGNRDTLYNYFKFTLFHPITIFIVAMTIFAYLFQDIYHNLVSMLGLSQEVFCAIAAMVCFGVQLTYSSARLNAIEANQRQKVISDFRAAHDPEGLKNSIHDFFKIALVEYDIAKDDTNSPPCSIVISPQQKLSEKQNVVAEEMAKKTRSIKRYRTLTTPSETPSKSDPKVTVDQDVIVETTTSITRTITNEYKSTTLIFDKVKLAKAVPKEQWESFESVFKKGPVGGKSGHRIKFLNHEHPEIKSSYDGRIFGHRTRVVNGVNEYLFDRYEKKGLH